MSMGMMYLSGVESQQKIATLAETTMDVYGGCN
jgi:hypothetical protein